MTIARDLPEQVTGDPVRLRAMIENLIDNAVKFTARGGLRFAVSAKPAPRGKIMLVFAVTDSGIGISPAEMKNCSAPSRRRMTRVSRRYGGTGPRPGGGEAARPGDGRRLERHQQAEDAAARSRSAFRSSR